MSLASLQDTEKTAKLEYQLTLLVPATLDLYWRTYVPQTASCQRCSIGCPSIASASMTWPRLGRSRCCLMHPMWSCSLQPHRVLWSRWLWRRGQRLTWLLPQSLLTLTALCSGVTVSVDVRKVVGRMMMRIKFRTKKKGWSGSVNAQMQVSQLWIYVSSPKASAGQALRLVG